MNGFEQQPQVQRQIPWKPVAFVAGACFLVVLIVIGAWKFVAWRQQDALQDAAVSLLAEDLFRSLERCEKEKNPEACRQELTTQQASTSGLAELCQELDGDARDQCVWGVARQQNDPEECETIQSDITRQACKDNLWYRLGKEQLSLDTCKEISDEALKKSCMSYVTSVMAAQQGCEAVGLDPSYCEAEDRLDEVVALKDPELCQTIPDEGLAAECEEGIGPGDPDLDGLSTPREEDLGTDPRNADTDADGLDDRAEVKDWGTDPLNPDSDGDGYLDGAEVAAGYSPVGPGAL